ncbi:MAG TPA: c-type cytochrome [Nannocystaceae bacterium]|nr:c-type cytochrome [Nannocystaceae bacterium]
MTLCACKQEIDLDPLDNRAPIEARVRPKAIVGGTLTLGEGVAVAADPDRDVVYVVDLETRKLRHTIALEAGDEPGRVVIADGKAHVVLRSAGSIASIALADGSLTRHALCPEPRGLAHDSDNAALWVACADGDLVQLDAATGDELDRTMLEPDLRDVVVHDGEVVVSLFRSAQLRDVEGKRVGPPDLDTFVPHVAWRTFESGRAGGIVMLHQLTSTEKVPIEPEPDDIGEGEDLPYGGGGGSSCEPGLSVPTITVVGADDELLGTLPIANAQLTVDAAVAHGDPWVALAMPGAEEKHRTMRIVPLTGTPCFGDEGDEDEPHHPLAQVQITSVAFTEGDTLVMLSREPAQLLFQDGLPDGEVEAIDLGGESRFDSGHEIFHRATDSGLSCATCHPEGTDDGHVWRFETLGDRRTQPLDISLKDTAPFHWNGDMEDVDMLMSEVLAHRMGGRRQSEARSASFQSWLFEQERPPARIGGDDPLVPEGEALFQSYGCDKCHGGVELGGPNTETFMADRLQVPSLRRVALRPPFMHDGRSATLENAVEDMIEKTTATTDAPPEDVDALAAYLRTL